MIEFLFDYLFILAYLVLLFLGSMLIYIIFLMVSQSLQKFSRSGLYFSPLFFPITLLFTFLDYKNNGSFGKVKAGLELGLPEKNSAG